MSITVSLGTNNSDNRELTKDITWSLSATNLTCDVYLPTDRLNPIVLLDKDKVDLTNINYMYIPEFGRYYFITNIVGAAGNRVELHGHVDVLFTYDAQIRSCYVVAERSTNQQQAYLHDGMRLFETYARNQYVHIGDVGAPDIMYLITLGSEAE